MEQPRHNAFWGPLIRDRLGDELPVAAEQVREVLEHPGWQVVARLLDEAKRHELNKLVSPKVLPQEQYVGVTRAAFALEVCSDVGEAVLFEAQRDDERRRSEAEAAERREKEAR